MDKITNISANRRTFFLRGSAAIGAGLAATSAAASPLVFDHSLPLKSQLAGLQHALSRMEDREAIRQLQIACISLLENRHFDAALSLFSATAEVVMEGETFRGEAIGRLFTETPGEAGGAFLHTGFRQDLRQQQDTVEIDDERQVAHAAYPCQVEVSIPHAETTVVESMARLQGQYASSRWQHGRLLVDYRREPAGWKISRLEFES